MLSLNLHARTLTTKQTLRGKTFCLVTAVTCKQHRIIFALLYHLLYQSPPILIQCTVLSLAEHVRVRLQPATDRFISLHLKTDRPFTFSCSTCSSAPMTTKSSVESSELSLVHWPGSSSCSNGSAGRCLLEIAVRMS